MICLASEKDKTNYTEYAIKVLFILIIGAIAIMICLASKKDKTNYTEYFEKKEILSDSLYVSGIFPTYNADGVTKQKNAEAMKNGSAVLAMAYGKCYEIRFPEEMGALSVVATDADPRALAPGESMKATTVRTCDGTPSDSDLASLLYIPQKAEEYLVIYTGDMKMTLSVCEQIILAKEDTAEAWYTPTGVKDFLGSEGSFGDYRWSSDEIYENLYEPLREKYPDYVKREHIGKDASDTYDMYCYIFEPKSYTQTVFLSAGMHSNEEDAYFALAYFMGEVANAKRSEAQLWFLRGNVRFIVIPLINVWGINRTHDLSKPNWSIRYNSTETDLNRDFEDQTQKETQNVCAVLEKYGKDISFGIDFHTTPNDNGSDLFFNFNVGAPNAAVNFKTTSHIYHRMREEGMITKERPLLVPSSSAFGTLAAMDGKYATSKTLQAYLWNEHGIPPITVEYMNFTSGQSPAKGSAEGLSMAVEIFGNFIIQNALFFGKR